jgi:multiple sugar transport system permease protein
VVRGPTARIDWRPLAGNLLLALFGVLFFLPMLWLIFASLDTNASWTIAWPTFSLANFQEVLSASKFQSLYNSAYLAVVSTVIATAAATLAGYALSRREIPLKPWLMMGVLVLTGIPISILIVPVYQMYVDLGQLVPQINFLTLLPTAVFLAVTSLPYEIWLVKNFVDAISPDLEEAAAIEGAGTLYVLRRVILPLALPGIGAAAIYGFINAWGSFLVPLILISDPSSLPGPVTIYGFIGSAVVRYGDIAAYSILYSLPVVILYVLMSRLFAGGFTLGGAVKG